MTTVLTLTGYSKNPRLPDDWLGGELFRPPFTRRDVIYSNKWFGQANFDDGRAKAKTAALSTRGNVVIAGHSMGARIACSLMDDPDMLDGCPPSRCVFVLGGHPDRKYCGASTVNYSGFVAAYGVDGPPDGVRYRVFDVARQYGIAEDYPQNRAIRAAIENVSATVHADYSNVRLGDPANITWTDPDNPNVTFILSPTYPLPSVDSRWWSLQRKAEEDAKLRPQIEKAYTRFKPVPAPTVNRMLNTNIGWDANTRRLVPMPPAAPFRPWG